MAGGRPTKPTALKLLQGNPGKRALPQNEPAPTVAEADVQPPRPLRGRALDAWGRLAPVLSGMRVLSLADLEKLALGCEAIGDYLDLDVYIRKVGRVYTTITVTGSKVYRPRPEVAMRVDAWRRASSILSEFGLSPSARAKVQTISDEEKDPFAAFLSRKTANGETAEDG